MTPMPLDEMQIRQHWSEVQNQQIRLHLFNQIDSTNTWLKQLPSSPHWELCCAESQTAGRGRWGRQWYSPAYENIYLSLRPANLPTHLQGLSLVICLSVYTVLSQLDSKFNLRVKWPNDLYWQDKKLCGCLIECGSKPNQALIIGLGLNVNSHPERCPDLERPWSSLQQMSGLYWNRNNLIASLVTQIQSDIANLQQHGFSYFQTQWQQLDLLKGQQVSIKHPAGTKQGQVLGVSETGELILLNQQQKEYLSAGEVSFGILT